ncbi:SRPBCC family protein [Halomonas maura]|uniref:SRPBCC family protein n=1 Tax=Halomonas maura TaxID=117606 RepID=UPI0025B527F5|nr:SRPBCC family protein [Halomonas maura]MDN3556794.1 SRPBCC family protein [Halomonas maura]
MTLYRFITCWRLEAPIDRVYRALSHPDQWPGWWPGLVEVEPLARGDRRGIGSRYRYTWRSRLGYRLCFAIRVTRVRPPTLIEAEARGDLEGVGRWELRETEDGTEVRYHWQVRTRRRWMNLLAPLARPLFTWSHHAMMRRGALGLAGFLRVRLLTSAPARE